MHRNIKWFIIFLLPIIVITTLYYTKDKPLGERDATPVINVSKPTGEIVHESKDFVIDLSNTQKGQILVKYMGDASKVKVQIQKDDEIAYTYDLSTNGEYETYPVSCGNGKYKITLNENIKDTKYRVIDTYYFEANLNDELETFTMPNQYVNYKNASKAVKKAQELAKTANNDLEVIENICKYIGDNIKYDYVKAETVNKFYIPDIDEVIKKEKGICFDYAVLSAAMIRSQGIPCRLELGYVNDSYHAWISVYIPKVNDDDNNYQYESNYWIKIDPTYIASGEKGEKMLDDHSNYVTEHYY